MAFDEQALALLCFAVKLLMLFFVREGKLATFVNAVELLYCSLVLFAPCNELFRH